MGDSDDVAFGVLHALKLQGFSDADPVAEATGMDRGTVVHELDAAHRAGFVARREYHVAGWALSPAGEARHARLLAGESRPAHADAVMVDVSSALDRLHTRWRRVCTDWQLRATGRHQEPNDHRDPVYDGAVLCALAALDDEVQAVCATLGATLGRMARYGPRLRRARAAVEAGDHDRFTRPLAGSYHDVWVELHRDVMVTSGTAATGRSAHAPAGAVPARPAGAG